MSTPITDLSLLLRNLEPVLNAGTYAYVSVPPATDTARFPAIAMVREAEGITLIVEERYALQQQWTVLFRCAWITLHVHSDLQAVGLTAAFARALGDAGISCNVVAGAFHDHIFVPSDRAQAAMEALQRLQRES